MGPSFVSKHRLRKKTFSGREKKILGFESTPNRDEILIPVVRVHLGVVAVADVVVADVVVADVVVVVAVHAAIDVGPVFII